MDYSNFKIDMPNDVDFIINTIKSHGHQAYAVGGCVRDSIMGLTPNDWDITTSALPSDIKEYFNKTIDTGIEHGTVTVMLHNVGYEVTTYRIDGEYKDGRHPSSVEFSDRLTDDLCRRDFTINAMAYNNVTGLVDEYGGIDDINNRIIKCVGNPIERFTEDALRMMRAIRFSAQLGFTIDEATWNAIKKLSPSISKISMERVHVELGKTLMSAHPDYVAQYSEAGLFAPILPVIDNALKSRYKRKILATLQHTPDNIYLRYAALFITYTPDEAAKTLRALKLDNKTVNTVSKLV